MASKLINSMLGASSLAVLGESPQKCTGPSKELPKTSSSSPDTAVDPAPSSARVSTPATTIPPSVAFSFPFSVIPLPSTTSMSMSLVAGPEDGGLVEELRFGLSSGTDSMEEAEGCGSSISSIDASDDGALEMLDGGEEGGGDEVEVADEVEGAVDMAGARRTRRGAVRSAASAGRGGKMISAGSICG